MLQKNYYNYKYKLCFWVFPSSNKISLDFTSTFGCVFQHSQAVKLMNAAAGKSNSFMFRLPELAELCPLMAAGASKSCRAGAGESVSHVSCLPSLIAPSQPPFFSGTQGEQQRSGWMSIKISTTPLSPQRETSHTESKHHKRDSS